MEVGEQEIFPECMCRGKLEAGPVRKNMGEPHSLLEGVGSFIDFRSQQPQRGCDWGEA